jgi:DnaJ-class molecular chaperone
MIIKYCPYCNKLHDVKFDCKKTSPLNPLSNINSLSNNLRKCNLCNGSGKLFDSKKFYLGVSEGVYKCPKCDGKGLI